MRYVPYGQLSVYADQLADMDEECDACVTCFASARCAGPDPRSLVPTGQAAIALGASVKDLTVTRPAYGEDREYLDEAARIRAELLRAMQRQQKLLEAAAEQADLGLYYIRLGMAKSPPDQGLIQLGMWLLADAEHASEVTGVSLTARQSAVEALTRTPVAFTETYDRTVDFVAAGGVMPHHGRWITGETAPATSTR